MSKSGVDTGLWPDACITNNKSWRIRLLEDEDDGGGGGGGSSRRIKRKVYGTCLQYRDDSSLSHSSPDGGKWTHSDISARYLQPTISDVGPGPGCLGSRRFTPTFKKCQVADANEGYFLCPTLGIYCHFSEYQRFPRGQCSASLCIFFFSKRSENAPLFGTIWVVKFFYFERFVLSVCHSYCPCVCLSAYLRDDMGCKWGNAPSLAPLRSHFK